MDDPLHSCRLVGSLYSTLERLYLDMSYLFPGDRSLLYPLFETYRLHPLDPTTDVQSYPLPGTGATQSRVGYNTHLLSFKETRARISFDHLAVNGRRGLYVDVEWNIVGFTIGVSIVRWHEFGRKRLKMGF